MTHPENIEPLQFYAQRAQVPLPSEGLQQCTS